MKTQWKEPQLKKLNLEETKAVEPIIIYAPAVTRSVEPYIGWKCPCCGEEKGYPFVHEEDARKDFKENHLPVCPKYDPATERCIS